MSYEKLNDRVTEMKEEILQAIRESVAVCSVKGQAEPDAPYGRGPKEALDHALALGEKLGFRTGNCGNRVGWVEYGEGEEMVAVLGHLDVVPLGEGWTYPPLGGEIHDGKMYGRGVGDDKGPTIGAIYALKAIRDLGLPIDRRIRVMFGTDEECGSSCVRYYIDQGEELPTIGFTPDAEYPCIFCEKGMSNYTLGKCGTEDGGDIRVLEFAGGTAANVVTPACTLTVAGDLDVKEGPGITVTRKDGKTTVESQGVGAHGSMPQLGVNAAVQLLNAVKHNHFGGDFQRMMDFILEMVGTETNGETLGIHYQDEETGETTVNLGVVKYDGKEMSLTLDIRYPKNAPAQEVNRKVEEAAARYRMEPLGKSCAPLLYVPKDSELVQKLMKVYRAATGGQEEPLAIGGGTYAKAFKNMVAFGPGFPGDPELAHQPDEYVEVDKLMKSIQITAAAMYELANK